VASSLDGEDPTDGMLRRILWSAFTTLSEDKLFECALDEDRILRTAAARQIQLRASDACFNFAMSLVNSHRFDHREISAFILGQIGISRPELVAISIPPLTKLLDDPYYEVRATAIYALSYRCDDTGADFPLILERVINLASDEAPFVRLAASHFLGFVYTESARQALEVLRDDYDTDVRKDAAYGLELHREYLEDNKSD
jgi:HEAT repeat protein